MVKEKKESDMVFEYDDCSVFLPEESPTYKKWIPQISDCLRKEMKGTKKAFALEDIVVLNQDDAKKFGIIKQ
ncbi:MAG: hypothetical protein HQK70_05240 [Desulfamplus sp.]|nr:hypothetical protein [Desulfamplus sp.]